MPGVPVTLIVCAPSAAAGMTVKEPVTLPLVIVQDDTGGPVVISVPGELEIAHVASAVLNPLPVTVTTVPTGPELEESVIVGVSVMTMNVAWAKSLPGVPVTMIVCAPNAAGLVTVNEPVT